MAENISTNARSATLRVPAFKGLYQYGDGIGTDPCCAAEATGALTTQGVLRPMAAHELLPPELPAPIETLARLHRRWHADPDQRDVLIAASDGQLYWALPDAAAWTLIALPDGWIGTRYQQNDWSCVTYEINPEGSDAPIDVLLLSNASDGMICVRGDNMTASIVQTPKKFGVIARHAERIWGGAIADDPDMLVYSAPYDPFDWTANADEPADGAGDVLQPSWDGDSFMALTTFGSQLIAFKRTRVWRILGADPGEYMFKEQYGGGAAYAGTVAVAGSRILMLGRSGLLLYNGESVTPFEQHCAHELFARMNLRALDKARACIHANAYYCALPLDDSQDNNAVLIYHMLEHTWLLREGVAVESFLSTEDALYYTSASTPGRVWRWLDDSWRSGCAVPLRWVGPWQDLNDCTLWKGSFSLRTMVECSQPVTLSISLQTEKKLKTKSVSFSPPSEGKAVKQKRIHFSGYARRFRVILESDAAVPWRMPGGYQLDLETDTE